MSIIGIDLGTSNSAAAVLRGGHSVIIPSAEGLSIGGKAFPSYVAGQVLVGEPARRQATANPESTCYEAEKMLANFASKRNDELKKRIEATLRETKDALLRKEVVPASERVEALKKGLKEAGAVLYTQSGQAAKGGPYAQTRWEGPTPQPSVGASSGEARPSDAGPRGKVVDAEYRDSTLIRKDNLLPFDHGAVVRVIDHSARLVGDAEKLSMHMRSVADLLLEADYWMRKPRWCMVQQRVCKSQTSGDAMPKLQVAVIGLGRLGLVCAEALLDESELGLAGVVRRPGAPAALPGRLQRFPVASHVREFEGVRAALVCVPADAVLGVARELLQARIPVVECACFEGKALEAHHAALGEAADNHHVAAVVGAGWDPGVLPLLRSAFDMLIPRGHTTLHRHPGLHLRHSAAVAGVRGVKGALAAEFRGDNGESQHYVYVELERGAELAQVQAAIAADPLFAGEVLQVFQVANVSELEDEDGFGVVLDRRGSATHGPHQSLLLEARFDPTAFSARIMLDAARKIPALRRGAHRYAIGL